MNVSIIIVSYNNFDVLSKCLNSIYEFTTEIIFEVIVVDNNSIELGLNKIIDRFENLTLIKNKENLGFAAANNQGARIAKGKYLLLLNNDTLFVENSIKKVFTFAEELNNSSIIGCQLLNEDKSYQESIVCFPSIWNTLMESIFFYQLFPKWSLTNKYYQNYLPKTQPFETDIVKGAFIFIKKSDFELLNGFDERFFFYSEETDLCYRFKKNGGKVYFFPLTKIYHLSGAHTNNNAWFRYQNLAVSKTKYFQKHFNRFSLFLILLVYYLGIITRIVLYFVEGLIFTKKDFMLKSKYFFRLLFVHPKNLFNKK